MNGYNFTDRVRQVLRCDREEANRLHHEYVGTEHIPLGLLREEKDIGAQVLVHQGLTLEAARSQTRELLGSQFRGGTQAKSSGSPRQPPAEPTPSGSADAKESLALPILAGAVVGLFAGIAGPALGLSGAILGAVAGALAAAVTRSISARRGKATPPA
jgi:hydrogenase maturation factor